MQEAASKDIDWVVWGGIINEIVKDGARLWEYFQDQKRKLFGFKSYLKKICFPVIAGPFHKHPNFVYKPGPGALSFFLIGINNADRR